MKLFNSLISGLVRLCGLSLALVAVLAIPTTAMAAEWTIMVYLNGDNDLEKWATADFNEMAAASYSSGQVNVIVQFDRAAGYDNTNGDWTTCKRFKLTSGMTPTAANQISDIGEQDMGDPNTLSAFGEWAIPNYPANKYMLVIWNHGNGWYKGGNGNSLLKGISWDNSSPDGNSIDISNGELATALNKIKTKLGKKLDVVAYDACMMGMWEVMHVTADYANAMVGSEETEDASGFNYTKFLNDLNATSTMSGINLATAVVNAPDNLATLSAIDLTKIGSLTAEIDTFAQSLLLTSQTLSSTAIASAARYNALEFYYKDHIDLYDFADKICNTAGIPSYLQTAAIHVKNAIGTAAVKCDNQPAYARCRGVAIYHPLLTLADAPVNDHSPYDRRYGSLGVAIYTQWDDYLWNYYLKWDNAIAKVITPEMLHHGYPNKGRKSYHFYTSKGVDCKFKLRNFTAGTQIKIDACIPATYAGDPLDNTLLKAQNIMANEPVYSANSHIASLTLTLKDKGADIWVCPNETEGMKQGMISFNDLTWNAANPKETGYECYVYRNGKYVETSKITYPPEPAGIEKGPAQTMMKPAALCKNCNEPGMQSKGSFVPPGSVVMCKDAGWFCPSMGPGAGGCFLIANNVVDHFEKGWTYNYSYNSNRRYWNAGDGPVIATFIYNYGCHDNMSAVCKFYKPNGALYYTFSQNFYCNDPGFWGYVAPGMYIYDGDWFPEGQWKLEYWIGGALRNTVYFDVCKAPTSNTLSFIEPTPAQNASISGNKGQYCMTAGISSGYLPGASQMKFYVDGAFYQAIDVHEALGTSVWNVEKATAGAHTIRAEVNSSYWGWVSTPTRTINVDNTPPATCTITSPANNATLTTLSASVSVSVSSDVVRVEYYVDGFLRGANDKSPFTQTISLFHNDDVAELKAIAYDAAGNGKISGINKVFLRGVKITSPLAGADLPNNGTITIEAKAVGTAPTKIIFYVDGVYKGEKLTSPYTYTWNAAGTSGSFALKAVAEYSGYTNTEDQINVIVGGDLGAWAYTSNTIGGSYGSSGAVIMNGYIYVMGGSTVSETFKNIERAKINPNGSLDNWQIAGQMSEGRFNTNAVHNEKYVYIVGGSNVSLPEESKKVDRIPIFANGSVGAAQILSSTLLYSRQCHEVVKSENYIYAIGGRSLPDGAATDKVEFTIINNVDGTLGNWTYTTSLPAGRLFTAAVVARGYIYVIGGGDNVTGAFNNVWRSKINTNGTLGSWVSLPSFPTTLIFHAAVVHNNFIYVYVNTDIRRAYVYEDGSLSSWITTYPVNENRGNPVFVTNEKVNDALYVLGGKLGGINNYTVEYLRTGTGPAITSVASSGITAKTATITWTTNIKSNSSVDYWTDGSWPNFFSTPVANTSPMVTSHSVTINANLEPLTKYYYRVVSQNDKGNTSMSGAYQFTTLAGASEGGLVACWPLNEVSGNKAYDASGSGNTGTLVNGPAWTAGQVNNALSFDGVDDYVEVPSSTVGTGNEMSISLWTTPYDQIAGSWTYHNDIIRSGCYGGGGWSISTTEGFNTSSCLAFQIGWITGTDYWWVPASATVTKNSGNHLVLVMNRNTGKAAFYRNGALVVETTVSVGSKPNTTGLRIGGDCAGTVKALIDEVRIYNRALIADEVKNLYTQGCLAGYWKLDEGAGTVTSDASGNSKTGTLGNGPTWVAGQRGYALSFATNAVITIPSTPLAPVWTLMAWVKTPLPNTGNWHTLFRGAGGDHQIIVHYDQVSLGSYDNVGGTGFKDCGFRMSSLSAGWHLVSATGHSGATYFFIDANYVGYINWQSHSDVYAIGNYQGGGQPFGTIDEVRLYSREFWTWDLRALHMQGSLAGWWKFDETSGTTACDASDNCAGGTLVNGPAWVTGKVGNALSFDGVNDYITIPDNESNSPTAEIAIAAWVKLSAVSSDWCPISFKEGPEGRAWWFGFFPGRADRIHWSNAGLSSWDLSYDIPSALNTWRHIAVTYGAGGRRLYVDGSLIASDAATGSIPNTSGSMYIGGGGWQPIKGLLDEVRLYNSALNADEITGLFNGTLKTYSETDDLLRKSAAPKVTRLSPCAPNPFTGQTTIHFQLDKLAQTTIKVYNIMGQEVKTLVNECLRSGYYSVKWDGRDANGNKVAAGVYLYRMQTGDYSKTNKMTVLR